MSGGEAPHAPDVVSTGKILMMCDGALRNVRNVPSCSFPRQQSLSRWILLEASTVHVAPLRAHLPARMSVSFALRLPDVAGYCVGGRGRRVSRGARPARLHRGSAVFRSEDVASLTTRTRRTRRRRPATSPSASASRDPDQSSPPGNRLVAAALSGLLVASPAALPGECLVRSSLDHASTSSSSSESTKRSWPAPGAPAPLTRAFAASASATPAKLELPRRRRVRARRRGIRQRPPVPREHPPSRSSPTRCCGERRRTVSTPPRSPGAPAPGSCGTTPGTW